MAVRLLEIIAPDEHGQRVETALLDASALDVWRSAAREGEGVEGRRVVIRALVETGDQAAIDAAQDALAGRSDWRILILPVDAAIPKPERDETDAKERRVRAEAREVLYNTVAKGTVIDLAYVLFVALSTVVAATALVTDNVAVLIGAMVIAPFLGPNLAFALGASLGDRTLMSDALKASAVGAGITLAMSVLVGIVLPTDLLSATELLARTSVGFDGIVVALASGACAALSLTSRAAGSLVGVMVAVALLPPASTVGIMLGAGNPAEAFGALTLLMANVACVVLAALVIFKVKGIAPRRWFEKQAAARAQRRAWLVWGLLLALLLAMIGLRQFGWVAV